MLEHSHHLGASRGLHERLGCGASADQSTDVIGDFEHLEDPSAASVPSPAAVLAAHWFVYDVANPQAEHGMAWVVSNICCDDDLRSLASLTKDPNKSLRDDRAQRGLEQKAFDAEIEQTRDRCGRRVSMQCREHEVPSQRGMNGDVR